MATKVGELLVEIVIDAASGNLSVRQLAAALGDLDVASAASVGFVGKIGEAFMNLATDATDAAVQLTALHDVTGIDTHLVSQWDKAAQQIGYQAGSIIKSAMGVHEMMNKISTGRQGTPGGFGQAGILPFKVGADGKPVEKTVIDLLQELGNKSSRYWSFGRARQQEIIGDIFPGSDKGEIYRLINETRAGTLHPEMIQAPGAAQNQDLYEVRRKEMALAQQLEGTFDRLLTSGGLFGKALDSMTEGVEAFNKYIDSKGFKNYMKFAINDEYRALQLGKRLLGSAYNAVTDPLRHPEAHLGRDLDNQASQRLRAFGGLSGDLKGKLDINIVTEKGHSQAWVDIGMKNGAANHVVVNAGNGGKN